MDKKSVHVSLQNRWKYLVNSVSTQQQAHVTLKQPALMAASAMPASRRRPQRTPRPISDRKHVRYYLGKEYPGVYATRRELECLKIYAADHTIEEAAKELGICYRAAESLIVGLRKKTGCAKAADLLKHPGLVRLMKNPKPVMQLRENRVRLS